MSALIALLELSRATLAAAAVFLLTGAALAPVVPSGPGGAGLFRNYYYGFLGAGFAGFCLFSLGASRALVLLALAALGGAGLYRILRQRSLPRLNDRIPVIGLAVLLLPLLFSALVYCVTDIVSGWDAYVIWFARVRLLDRWIPFRDFALLNTTNPEYPFLGAFNWWLTAFLAGASPEIGRVCFVLLYFCFFLDLPGGGRSKPRPALFLLVAVLAYWLFADEWIGGYQDGPLMLLVGWSARILCDPGKERAARTLPFVACFAVVKAEGGVLAAILIGSFLLSNRGEIFRDGWARRTIPYLIVALCILGVWPLIQLFNGIDPRSLQGGAFSGISVAWFAVNAWRVPVILRAMALGYPPVMRLIVLAVALLLPLWRRSREASPNVPFLLLALLLHHLFVGVTFWATHAPFEWHVSTALDRLLGQCLFLWPVLLMELVRTLEIPFFGKNQSVSSSSSPSFEASGRML